MDTKISQELQDIIQFFPEAELPVLLSEDQLPVFQDNCPPFPQKFIDEVLQVWEKEIDEFTEFIPCVSLPMQDNYIGLVYWKGALLKYEFVLVTIDKKGELLYRKPIASTIVDGELIKKSVAYIDPDLNINIIAGQTEEGKLYDSSMSQNFTMEILVNGEIVVNIDHTI